MAVTVISRPVGHKLLTTEVSAVINDYSGDAIVYVPGGHSLSDGDYVFIESNFDSYNGFKYADSIAYDHFKIRNSEGGDYVQFKQEADVIFYVSELDHGFQCVHLPIVYELYSNIYPVNTVEDEYTPRTISFAANSNGYTGLQGSTNFININALDYIELIGDGPLAGVYQILDYIDPDEIVINLVWNSSNVFSGYELRKYYNNYFVTVNVYGGLDSNHPWYSEKPIELISTLKFIPDSDGRIKFSISEILKGQITTRNNLTLDTLPNNLDFYTQFYISYSESYDTSDGVDVSVFTGDVVTDDFIGHALNAMLPFKSLNQGHMSDYVDTEDQLARWLTTQDRPVGVAGYFFDLSFINQYYGIDINIVIFKSINDVVTETETIEILNPGQGILRVPINIENGYDQYCIAAHSSGRDDITFPIILPNLSTGFDVPGPGIAWNSDSNPDVTLPGTVGTHLSAIYGLLYSFSDGFNYEITFNIDSTDAIDDISFYVLDSIGNIIYSTSGGSLSTGNNEKTFSFPGTHFMEEYGIRVSRTVAIGTSSVVVDINTQSGVRILPGMPPQQITEQICIDIVSDCNTFTNDNLRLLEGGEFRELE